MRNFVLFFIAIVFAVSCTSTSAQITQSRNAKGFTSIDVSEGIKVMLTMSNKESVEVTAPESYIDKVITEVNGSTLKIYIKGNNTGNKGRNVEVKVSAKNINSIESSSGSSIKTNNNIETNELRISVSSGANVYINCDCTKILASASSGSGASLKGSTTYLSADASSGAHIKALELTADKVKADVSSGAHVKVNANKEINASASSGGSVKYTGSPSMVDINKSSGGSVRKN